MDSSTDAAPAGLRHRSVAADHDARAAAVKASSNVPARARGKAKRPPPHVELYENMPDYLVDNEYIKRFYRRESTVASAVVSAFNLHNETVNIWTHALGFVLFVCLAVYVVAYHRPAPLALSPDQVDRLWERVQGRFHHLSDRLGGGLDAGLHRLDAGLHSLQQGLSDNLHALEGRVSQSVAALEDLAVQGVAALTEELSSLGSGLAHLLPAGAAAPPPDAADAAAASSDAPLAGALRAHVQQQLRPVLQWPAPRWPLYVYFAGAMVCLATSAVCHLLGCCQKHISTVIWRFDYTGIAVLIVCSFVPAVYYAFLCQPGWRTFYLTTTILMGAATAAVALPDVFQARRYRNVRAAVFVGLGLWGAVPLGHLMALHWGVWSVTRALQLDLLMGATYLLGAFLFATRFPESSFPGRFDLLGASHQLFHGCVVAAAYLHYRAVMVLLEWRDASGGCAAHLPDGPMPSVLARLREEGSVLGIDQAWHTLGLHLQRLMGLDPDLLDAAAVAVPLVQ